MQEFQQVWCYPSKKVRAQRSRWKPPDTGFVKANFDGAIFEDISVASIGVAVQNEHGEVVVAMAEKILVPDSVFTLEKILVFEKTSQYDQTHTHTHTHTQPKVSSNKLITNLSLSTK